MVTMYYINFTIFNDHDYSIFTTYLDYIIVILYYININNTRIQFQIIYI